MKCWIAFVLTLLNALPVWLIAQDLPPHYIWNRKGVAVYTAPTPDNLVTLPYGMEINILEILPDAAVKPLFNYQSDEDTNVYNASSKWLLIDFGGGQRGYVTDTYLLAYPPNMFGMMSDYFSQLSAIAEERVEGNTDQFCNRYSYTYKNGIRYVYTDFGPCESCGHGVVEISLPGWTLHQAFVFITNFDSELWDIDGLPIESYQEHIDLMEGKESYPASFQWVYFYDSVTLTETESGVEVRIDTML